MSTVTEPPHTHTFGLDTFGDISSAADGTPYTHADAIRSVVEQGVLADELGIDNFSIGEHHTDDFPMPAGDVVLGAIAARTSRIGLGSAVTVLSSDDPVRVFQRYSTLNAISGGRAEVTLGRGSSTESFPLFGYDLADYNVLFEEKLNLFAEVLKGDRVTWQGTVRPSLRDQEIVPGLDAPLPVWVGVGGNPNSVLRAARYGFNLRLAIIGGSPTRFRPLAQLYFRALGQLGFGRRPIGIHSPGHVAETDEQAIDDLWPDYLDLMTRMSRVRGFAIPTKEMFRHEIGPEGSLYVGSPTTVAQKIAHTMTALDADRFDLKYAMGRLSEDKLRTNIELYATEVVPRVRKLLGD
ncbi:LLM class flavin-dependent oxidoreductase [Streptomyces sp. 35G-GA-8]|uniref:LLM class flavin-dependent oxidoreductase n=1 Tax=Streptomyces sp. 35G-GA-8 TaxID=2939434 RepID=UPI00201E809A|nr:LLM class flavin-dependent oxidoreductase [Streptomyces sp. 35G-GA-8]MCL7382605.1 LLM class flavin-dependent oxidoreductase [Streptomyces sp. 35G-GA-8]